jgi:hypothetical protein
MAVWILLMHMLDIYIVVLPPCTLPGRPILDFFSLVAIGCTLAAVFLGRLATHRFSPVRDPRLAVHRSEKLMNAAAQPKPPWLVLAGGFALLCLHDSGQAAHWAGTGADEDEAAPPSVKLIGAPNRKRSEARKYACGQGQGNHKFLSSGQWNWRLRN